MVGGTISLITERMDAFVTGGSEAVVTQSGIGGFNAMKALSERNDDPKTASRPFDLDRDGFVLGEGGACVILEEYEHAKKRGANILAELAGYGATADAFHVTAPHENGVGGAAAMRMALESAQANVDELGYINAHGTGTPLNDQSETRAIKAAFGEQAYQIPISSSANS